MTDKKNILVYPVILRSQTDGYSVEIPDIDGGIWTSGINMEEALLMAKNAIGSMLEDQINYPQATRIEDITVKNDEIKTVVYLDIAEYRRDNPKTIRKNVTVPEYLVKLGKQKHLNFSSVLTEALKNKLEV